MSEHTKGPWYFHEIYDHGEPQGFAIKAGIGFICETPNDAEEYETEKANARLIAATPELLEACKALLACDDDQQEDGIFGKEIYAKAKAAIAKATNS